MQRVMQASGILLISTACVRWDPSTCRTNPPEAALMCDSE